MKSLIRIVLGFAALELAYYVALHGSPSVGVMIAFSAGAAIFGFIQ